VLVTVLAASLAHAQATFRGDELARAKALVASHDARVQTAFVRLRHQADSLLGAPVVAVTDKKTQLPPSGNPHDYYSLSPYWWPDPAKPDGLPYVRRDGVTNPESKRDLDQPRVAAMGSALQTLSLAYYFTGDERYAARAARQLRAWFLDSATAMTPHLRFSQLVKGNPAERGSGIIDTRWFIEAVDAAVLLRGSRSWTAGDERALQAWLRRYVDWLLASPNGTHEHEAKNNHGSWYAAQTATYAMFVGDTARARAIVEETKARIGAQIKPDGAQPAELERTRSMHYSAFNVEALSRVAEIGRQLGVDLWTYEAPEGGSLKKAIDHLVPYMVDPSAWRGEQIDAVEADLLIIHLRRAKTVYGDATYAATLGKLPAPVVRADRSALLYP
jgi:hypothetical protein